MAENTKIEWAGQRGRAVGDRTGPNNPNWRGGRSITDHGYVLIRVGKGHHLADVRGYAYEHRLVAEQKLGRRLLPGEEVHHRDEDHQNNDPDNLDVKGGRLEHANEHRKRTDLRPLSVKNYQVQCACGCGDQFMKYDVTNRPRRFLPGHNLRR